MFISKTMEPRIIIGLAILAIISVFNTLAITKADTINTTDALVNVDTKSNIELTEGLGAQDTQDTQESARSTEVILINLSKQVFTLGEHGCVRGVFVSDQQPPQELLGETTSTFKVQSNPIQGTVGLDCSVKYKAENDESFKGQVINPFKGENSANSWPSGKLTSEHKATKGNHNEVRFEIRDKK